MSTDNIVNLRNRLEQLFYLYLLKPILFRQDPEKVHDRFTKVGARLGRTWIGRRLTGLCFGYANPSLEQEIKGIRFKNPIGLAAGFDKNAKLVDIMPAVGFGWMEIGSITARPCLGNQTPRLHRLPKSQALVVNYGLMNDGVDRIAKKLEKQAFQFPVGTSLAPTNDAQTADYRAAIQDYLDSYQKLKSIGAYTTLNLSCPNTCNDQPFANPKHLQELLVEIGKIPSQKPLFLKLSPDFSIGQLDDLLSVAAKHGVDGVICTNLTKDRKNDLILDQNLPAQGGISGKVLNQKSDAIIAHVAKAWGKQFVIVGCGGVFTAEDAYRKIRLGASLIQLVTGLIYQGPQSISQINLGLVRLLKRDGFSSVDQAVGVDTK